MVACHHAALFYRIIEQRQRRRCAVGAAAFKSHFLKYPCNGVALLGRRSKRKVNDAERNREPFGSFLCNKLSHTGNFERSLFNCFGNNVKRFALAALQSMIHNSRAADSDIDYALRLTYAVEGAGHERVILNRVCKNNKLCAAEAARIRRPFRSLLNNLTHEGDSVHIDAGLC